MNEEIVKVQEQTDIDGNLNGYIVNGSEIFPLNSARIQEVLDWLKTNSLSPLYTEDEILEKSNKAKVAQAKSYLQSTDYKMLPDYDKEVTEIRSLRQEARELIRTLEVSDEQK